MTYRISIGFFLYLILLSASAQPPSSISEDTRPSFIENRGQVIDQNNNPSPAVLYLLHSPGMNVQLRKGGFSYDLFRTTNNKQQTTNNKQQTTKAEDPSSVIRHPSPGIYRVAIEHPISNIEFNRIDIDLPGANPDCIAETFDPSPGFLNYYTTGTPEEGVTNVRSFKTVRYRNIYPDIDLEFCWDVQHGFKYNFVVHPGGDLFTIRLKISGPKISLAPSGSLLFVTTIGTVEEQIPESYFEVNGIRQEIRCLFRKVKENLYGLETEGKFPVNSTLVIDPIPSRRWATYYGGEGNEYPGTCSIDPQGNIIFNGITTSTYNIATAGAFQVNLSGSYDAFLVKFTRDGQRIWGTYFGGPSEEWGSGSNCVANTGDIYIAGTTSSTSGIATLGSFQPVHGGGWMDAYLVKFDHDGQRIWGTYYGASGVEDGFGCAVDNSGNVYLCGGTYSTDSIATPGAYQQNLGNLPGWAFDCFLVKFNNAGQRLWGTYYGGTFNEEAVRCKTDASGNVIIVGFSGSGNAIASPGAWQASLGNTPGMSIHDGIIVKFTSAGDRVWGTYYGGSEDEYLVSGSVLGDGTIYVTGYTYSPNNIASAGSFQSTLNGVADACLAKFSPTGQRLWGTYYGGSGYENAGQCAVDDSGYVFMPGYTTSPNNIATPNAYQSVQFGGWNGFLTKFSQSGQRAWGTYYADSCNMTGCAVTGDSIYVTGTANAHLLIATPGSFQPLFTGGASESFLVKFVDCYSPDTASGIAGPDTICLPQANVIYSIPAMNQATSYLWSVPSGINIISGQNTTSITVNFTTGATSGYINVRGHNNCGYSEPNSLFIYLKQSPVPVLTGNDTVCIGDTAVYSTAHGMLEYLWIVSPQGTVINGGTPADSTVTILWSTGGLQFIKFNYQDTNGCWGSSLVKLDVFVSSGLPVSVSVIASATTICAGTPVTFTAIPVNGGTNPSYQWQVNGINVGTNQDTYTYVPSNLDLVSCILSSSEVCTTNNPASSIQQLVIVNPILPVSVTISPSSNPVCMGSPVTFTATPVNGGTTPAYQWQVNGLNAGTNLPTYTYNPASGDLVSCVLTSSEICTTNNPASSIPVIVTVNPILPVSVAISASLNPICGGLPVTFTANPVNGGVAPAYQWRVNGLNVGSNQSTYTYIPSNLDLASCILTSSELCTSNNPALSNTVSLNVIAAPVVTFTFCFDTITTLIAKPIKLKGGIPLGGSYTGPGVNLVTGVFTPSIAGLGSKTITYTYTNAGLCSASKTRKIVVQPAPAFACGNNLLDIRDGKSYSTVQLGAQCWMAADLDYGTEIPSTIHQMDNCLAEKYVLTSYVPRPTYYQWDELMLYDPTPGLQGLCPPGWHIPTEADWNTLFAFYTSNGFAASPLKYTGYSGFNALLTGVRHQTVQWNFQNFGVFYWSSDSHGPYRAWAHGMNDPDPSVSVYPSLRSNAFSVRCLRD